MPGQDIVYLGDSARVPYGTRPLQTVRRFAMEDASFLLKSSPKMIVVACNTASAAAAEQLEKELPVPVVDVIRPGAAAALSMTDGPVGVIATEATVNSGAYQRAIAALDPRREVFATCCPLLVPIVEEGRGEDDPIVLHVLGDYLRELQRRRPGALILGCTHYPLLAKAIGKLMGPQVPLVDSGRAAAAEVQRRLQASDMLSDQACGGGLFCCVTENAERFSRLAQRFGGRKPDELRQIGTEELIASYRGPSDAGRAQSAPAAV